MNRLIKQFIDDESGATMVEYAVLVALIAVAAIVIIATLGTQIDQAFQSVSAQMPAAGGGTGEGG